MAAQALQMTGGAEAVRFGPCDPASWRPDLEWLAAELSSSSPPRMVVLVNPCNPTGAGSQRLSWRARDSLMQLRERRRPCKRAQCWLCRCAAG